MVRIRFTCHACRTSFDGEVDNEWGMYEFLRCPVCESARTTLVDPELDDGNSVD